MHSISDVALGAMDEPLVQVSADPCLVTVALWLLRMRVARTSDPANLPKSATGRIAEGHAGV